MATELAVCLFSLPPAPVATKPVNIIWFCVQTWARGQLMALSKGKLRFADTLLDCLLDGKTEEEVARDCTANLHCGKEKAMTFAVELFR